MSETAPAARQSLSIMELLRRLKKRREAVEAGDATGGTAFDRGPNAEAVREELGIRSKKRS